MAAAGATLCSAHIGPQKEKKNLRECCKYLKENRLDRTQFWRRVGDVLVCNMGALEHAMEKSASQQPPKGNVVGCCSCGVAHPSRDKCGGDCTARRRRQRVNRDRSRDDCILSCALARALNPLQGGSAPRNTERPVKLQSLQPFAVDRFEEGNSTRSKKDQAIYVGISNPTDRLAETNEGKQNGKMVNDKKGQITPEESERQNKTPRGISDGLLLVVTARINGHPVQALIDSGATRCFVTLPA